MKIKSSYFFLILFFIQVFSSDIHSKELPMYGIPGIVNFNRQNYKAGTQNWKITQADNGLIYSANNDGVIEYDGTSWRLLSNHKMGLARSVFAFEKRVYCGGYNEFGYFESNGINDLEYTSLMNSNSIEELGDVWNIFLYNDKIIFQADKGIIQYDYRNENILLIPARSRITTAFHVNGLFLLHDEAVGLMELRGNEIYEIIGGDIFAGQGIGTILPLSSKKLLIGTISKGIYVWDHNGFKVWDSPASEYLNDANIFCGIEYRNDELAFGTIQSGVVITDSEGNIKSMVNKDRGLNNNTVLCLFPDKEGNLWAGLDNGIAYLTYNSPINFIQDYYDIGTGYAVNFHNKDIYFGTNQGLYHIDYEEFCDPLKLKADFARIQELSGQVWSLFTDKKNVLLCGHNNGIYEVSPNLRQISPSSVRGAWVFRYPPKRDNLLIVGTYNGLVLLKASNGRWEYVKKIEGFNMSSRFMEWDKEGRLWVSHGSLGLFRLTFSDNFEKLLHVEDISAAAKLPAGLTFNLTSSNEGLLFSSKNGIYGYDDNSKSFFKYNINKYFIGDEYPSLVQEDDNQNLWFYTKENMGVLRKLEDGSIQKVETPFASLKGKLVNGFEYLYVINERNILIGIEDGFAHYSVNELKSYQNTFNIHIRGFNNLRDSVSDPFYQSAERAPAVPQWDFDQNSYEVRYSATHFESPQIYYSTYLEGFDNHWSDYSKNNQRQFTNLPEGSYNLWIKAKNIHEVESNSISFKFIISPPWYRSFYAKVLYIILLTFLLVAGWYVQQWLIKRSRLLALKKQEQKFRITEELLKNESLEKEKEMIKLRNEKLRNEMVFKEKELVNSTMNVIQKNEFLLKVKDELNSVANSSDQPPLKQKINQIIRRIDRDIDNDSQWELFEIHLEMVHEDFLNRLRNRFSDLSARELKLCAYLRMDMTSKEISSLMNISVRAVENNRYKLRKKFGLDGKDNLIEFINSI